MPAFGLDWDSARTEARSRSFLGQQGYLATIPSAEINELVSSRLDGAQNVWFGACADNDYPYRYWRWADGPLAGQELITCTNWTYGCDSITDPSIYNSWAANEPNNYDGEWVAVTNLGRPARQLERPGCLHRHVRLRGRVRRPGDWRRHSVRRRGHLIRHRRRSRRPRRPYQRRRGPRQHHGDRHLRRPASDGGTPITRYTVTGQPDGGNTPCPSSPCSVTGLTNGTD